MIQDLKMLWIMKPTSKCQGKGIFIVSKLQEVTKWRAKSTAEN